MTVSAAQSATAAARGVPANLRSRQTTIAVSLQADLAAIRATLAAALTKHDTDIAAQRTAIAAITAKLDLDAGTTDTNYAATCNPAALTTTTAPAALGTTP